MTDLIHCRHCHEDTNGADWDANQQRCLHCDRPQEQDWTFAKRRSNPLLGLKTRLEIARFLRSKPVYA